MVSHQYHHQDECGGSLIGQVYIQSPVHSGGRGGDAEPARVASQRFIRGAEEPRQGRLVSGSGKQSQVKSYSYLQPV